MKEKAKANSIGKKPKNKFKLLTKEKHYLDKNLTDKEYNDLKKKCFCFMRRTCKYATPECLVKLSKVIL